MTGSDHLNVRDPSVLLRLLLDEPQTRYAEDELARELGWPPSRVEAALADLVGAGLAHHHEGFALASRAAVRAAELL